MSMPYEDFIKQFKKIISEYPNLLNIMFSNIFTMRQIDSKIHGDLAEIAITEFINQYMHGFTAAHVGKDLFRKKSREEDIQITNKATQEKIPISLKTYGSGPLQLSTDKDFDMYRRLKREKNKIINSKIKIKNIFKSSVFTDFSKINLFSFIYDKEKKQYNIFIFNYNKAQSETEKIIREDKTTHKKRKYPVYKFYNKNDDYICEVRSGDASANALRRGLWTHTIKGRNYFDSLTNGWIEYCINLTLIQLFPRILIAPAIGHYKALKYLQDDIEKIKQNAGL